MATLFSFKMEQSLFLSDIKHIKSEMNKMAKNGTPFLVGVNYELSQGFLIESPLNQTDIFFCIKGRGNKKEKTKDITTVFFQSYPTNYDTYHAKFDIVHKGLKQGYSFLSNLTIKTPIETNLSFGDIFELSNAPYQLYVPNRFVCFSPERFVKIENGIISSNPMKGTIDATIPDAENVILNDFKETAEHNTIVDLIRNDLSIVASDVHVKRFRYIDRIQARGKEILQVSSEIEGKLPTDYLDRLGDIFFDLLPAGSICGAPKAATVSLIHSAEKEERDFYTGVFGYFDGATFDSGVLIRFIEKEENKMYFRSGGGITAYSNCEDEYKEVLNKIYLPFA